jgi:tetratricopeptide (TPR) repeat protein/tRNA A-37 threonylcarbamoyl transferase component Bud32
MSLLGGSIGTCARCGACLPTDLPDSAIIVQCLGCEFVFPRAEPEPEADAAALELAETMTRRWSCVRSDRYRLTRLLGKGVQGSVFLARHLLLEHTVVVKVVTTEKLDWAATAVARLLNEARAGFRVNHPNVARVMDCDRFGDAWYFVMEYVPGRNLKAMLEEAHRFCWEQAADIGRQAADGLDAIHRAGVLHRDIKPANLLLTPDGQIKITDLGLVKILYPQRDASVTHEGQAVGTPLFMAPELFRADYEPDRRTDIYALGATLYYLAVGCPPFDGLGLAEVARKHREAPLVWPGELADQLPSHYCRVVEKCMAKSPAERFEDARALAVALDVQRGGAELVRSAVQPVFSSPPRGIALLPFRDLSKQAGDEWLGEAIAEYLTSRLMEQEGIHVADGHALATVLHQRSGARADTPTDHQILDAARLTGAGVVVTGTVQCSGEDVRVTAHALRQGHDRPQFLGRAVGTRQKLFALQDQLAGHVLQAVTGSSQSGERPALFGETDSQAAFEAYVRAKRAFVGGQYNEAIALAQSARKHDSRYLEPVGLIGACYMRQWQYERAEESHRQQMVQAAEQGNERMRAQGLGNLGVMNYYKGDYDSALELLSQAAEIESRRRLSADLAKTRGNMGFAYLRLGRLKEAEAAFGDAIELNRSLGDLASMLSPYNGMGEALLAASRHRRARQYFRRALALARELNDRVNVGITHMHLGRCACLTQQFDEAAEEFDRALAELEQTRFWNGLTLVYQHLAEMHLQQGDAQQAFACIDKRIELAQKHANRRMECAGWEQKARAHQRLGQQDEALAALRQSLQLSAISKTAEESLQQLQLLAQREPFR